MNCSAYGGAGAAPTGQNKSRTHTPYIQSASVSQPTAMHAHHKGRPYRVFRNQLLVYIQPLLLLQQHNCVPSAMCVPWRDQNQIPRLSCCICDREGAQRQQPCHRSLVMMAAASGGLP